MRPAAWIRWRPRALGAYEDDHLLLCKLCARSPPCQRARGGMLVVSAWLQPLGSKGVPPRQARSTSRRAPCTATTLPLPPCRKPVALLCLPSSLLCRPAEPQPLGRDHPPAGTRSCSGAQAASPALCAPTAVRLLWRGSRESVKEPAEPRSLDTDAHDASFAHDLCDADHGLQVRLRLRLPAQGALDRRGHPLSTSSRRRPASSGAGCGTDYSGGGDDSLDRAAPEAAGNRMSM